MTSVVPTPGGRRPLARTIAVLALVVLTTVALRGTLPTIAPAVSENRPDGSAAAWIGLLMLLSASILITAVALLTRSSGRSIEVVEDDRGLGDGPGSWSVPRIVVFVLAAAVVWVLLVLLLNRLQQLGQPAPDGVPTAPTQSPPTATPAPSGEKATSRTDDDVLSYLAATVMALAMLMLAGAVVAGRRRRRADDVTALAEQVAEDGAAVPPGHLAAAAELGLTAVEDLSREPREAIIACYAAMEQALAGAPGAAPRESDTPSEVLSRAVATHAVRPDSAATLVDLFAEARFSTHVMSEGHRETAERALRAVLDELRSVP